MSRSKGSHFSQGKDLRKKTVIIQIFTDFKNTKILFLQVPNKSIDQMFIYGTGKAPLRATC